MWKNRRDKRKPVIEDFIEERTLHFYRIVDCRRWTSLQTYHTGVNCSSTTKPRYVFVFRSRAFLSFSMIRVLTFIRMWFKCWRKNWIPYISLLRKHKIGKRARICTSITEEVTINIEKITYSHWLYTLATRFDSSYFWLKRTSN